MSLVVVFLDLGMHSLERFCSETVRAVALQVYGQHCVSRHHDCVRFVLGILAGRGPSVTFVTLRMERLVVSSSIHPPDQQHGILLARIQGLVLARVHNVH